MVKAQTFAQAVINFLHLCDEPYWGSHIINSRIEQADNTTLWSFRIKLSGTNLSHHPCFATGQYICKPKMQ